MALLVVATITAEPGWENIVEAAMHALIAPTRAEQNCWGYEVFQSETNPAVFVTLEKWRDRTDFDAHMRTPHMVEVQANAGELVSVEPVLTYTLRPLAD